MENIWTIEPVAIATLPVPAWECVFGRNDCSMRDLTFWTWILRCGDKIGLIDTGLPIGPALAQLNKANQKIDPKSVFSVQRELKDLFAEKSIRAVNIDFVLITQLITYCTGGLIRENFPSAHVYCAWEGMQEFLTCNPGHPPREFYLTPESWAYTRDLLVEERITFAKSPVEVAPGLIFEPTGGHHPGSAGVRVQTAKGIVGILETAFIEENVSSGLPIGIAENASLCREVIATYKSTCDLVLAGHEPQAHQQLISFLS